MSTMVRCILESRVARTKFHYKLEGTRLFRTVCTIIETLFVVSRWKVIYDGTKLLLSDLYEPQKIGQIEKKLNIDRSGPKIKRVFHRTC